MARLNLRRIMMKRWFTAARQPVLAVTLALALAGVVLAAGLAPAAAATGTTHPAAAVTPAPKKTTPAKPAAQSQGTIALMAATGGDILLLNPANGEPAAGHQRDGPRDLARRDQAGVHPPDADPGRVYPGSQDRRRTHGGHRGEAAACRLEPRRAEADVRAPGGHQDLLRKCARVLNRGGSARRIPRCGLHQGRREARSASAACRRWISI